MAIVTGAAGNLSVDGPAALRDLALKYASALTRAPYRKRFLILASIADMPRSRSGLISAASPSSV